MCGRFSLFVPQSDLENQFDAETVDPIEPRYNIAPMENIDVISNTDPDRFDQHQWGFQPGWWDTSDRGRPPINARGETVAEKHMFRDAFENHRCLVIADGYYEWHGEQGSKRPYRITRTDDEPFAFAGIWTSHTDNGDAVDTCAIITTEPNDIVEQIHDRMPVMLDPDQEHRWLQEDDPTNSKRSSTRTQPSSQRPTKSRPPSTTPTTTHQTSSNHSATTNPASANTPENPNKSTVTCRWKSVMRSTSNGTESDELTPSTQNV